VNLDPAERYALVCDLGIDQVRVYGFDRTSGKLSPNPHQPPVQLPPGAGPRHLAFHPDGRRVYVIDEIDSTVATFDYDAADGTLRRLQIVSTLPPGYTEPNSTADIHVHPNGRFVYGSNRGADSIAIFVVDRPSGELTPVGWEPTRGKTPRNFTLDPTGTILLVANQDSDNIVAFRVDEETGLLGYLGDVAQVPSPSCLKLWPVEA
jgi:6-phosphogluconolactonase